MIEPQVELDKKGAECACLDRAAGGSQVRQATATVWPVCCVAFRWTPRRGVASRNPESRAGPDRRPPRASRPRNGFCGLEPARTVFFWGEGAASWQETGWKPGAANKSAAHSSSTSRQRARQPGPRRPRQEDDGSAKYSTYVRRTNMGNLLGIGLAVSLYLDCTSTECLKGRHGRLGVK